MLENQKTWIPKRICAQMGNGQRSPFCAGKLNLNHIIRSCAQMGYGETFYVGKPENSILFFRIIIKTTFFFHVRQSMPSIEMYETNLCKCQKEDVHKWVIVKNSHFVPKN